MIPKTTHIFDHLSKNEFPEGWNRFNPQPVTGSETPIHGKPTWHGVSSPASFVAWMLDCTEHNVDEKSLGLQKPSKISYLGREHLEFQSVHRQCTVHLMCSKPGFLDSVNSYNRAPIWTQPVPESLAPIWLHLMILLSVLPCFTSLLKILTTKKKTYANKELRVVSIPFHLELQLQFLGSCKV